MRVQRPADDPLKLSYSMQRRRFCGNELGVMPQMRRQNTAKGDGKDRCGTFATVLPPMQTATDRGYQIWKSYEIPVIAPPVAYPAESFTSGGWSNNTAKGGTMQKLLETLAKYGVTVPDDKATEIKAALSQHYKNAAEVSKTVAKLELERDGYKEQAENSAKTLKSFEGVDHFK